VETQKLLCASHHRRICPGRFAISQNESYHKEQNKWIYEAFEITDDITLHSLGVHFSLADTYIDVEFEETTGDANL
jgi:hypothetical protein